MSNTRRRGAGRPKFMRIAEALDHRILKLIAEGRECVDPTTGAPVVGDDGKPVRKEPTAGDLGAATKWVAVRSSMPGALPAVDPHGVGELLEKMRRGKPEGAPK